MSSPQADDGFEFPDDPDAAVPVTHRTEQTWYPDGSSAFRPDAPAGTAPVPAPAPPFAQQPVQPFAQPPVQQPVSPSAPPAPPTGTPAPQPPVEPVVFAPPTGMPTQAPTAPLVEPSAPGRRVAQPPVPQAQAPSPPTSPVPTAAAAPSAPEVVRPDEVADLLGFNPDALAKPQAPEHTGHAAYLAPAPTRAPQSVPVDDPRGDFGPKSGGGSGGTGQTHGAVDYDLPAGRPEIERLLVGLVRGGGSDMHIAHGEIPRYRVSGALLDVAGEAPMTTTTIERMLAEILLPVQWEQFKDTGDVDAAYAMRETQGAAITVRFRVNVYRSMDETGAVFRVIPTKIVPLDQLGILPQVKELAQKPRGLILFCGPTGSGKSTSMAGLVDEINTTRTERIFTLEDPIEFTHFSKSSLINHREVGVDTDSFLSGLRSVRRQDPDVILIGEMRDYETIGAAIEAADTGHLVIATLHTNSAPDTISRIINSFPAERQEQIRITLAETLLAVICQTLVPSPSSERGRVVAQEIMLVTPGVANNIRMNDIPSIKNSLTDQSTGSISLDAHLAQLIRENKITRKEAMKKASSPESLGRMLGGVA